MYRRILDGTIAFSKELGFASITSEHAPGNNAVIIAKLKAGFRIYNLDVTPEVVTSLRLMYFHNPDFEAAYNFRCGLATLNARTVSAAVGAMPTLSEQTQSTSDLMPTT